MEPAAAVAFAGLDRLLADGTIAADDVGGQLLRTPSRRKAHPGPVRAGPEFGRSAWSLRTSSLRRGWARRWNASTSSTTIAVIDDNAQDSLIRRLLQATRTTASSRSTIR